MVNDLIIRKKTESVGYDVVRSHEWLISSGTPLWSAQEDVDKLVTNKINLYYLIVFYTSYFVCNWQR